MPPPLSSSAPTGRRSLAPPFPPARTPRPERGWLSSLFGGGGTEGAPPHTPPTPPKGLSAEPLSASGDLCAKLRGEGERAGLRGSGAGGAAEPGPPQPAGSGGGGHSKGMRRTASLRRPSPPRTESRAPRRPPYLHIRATSLQMERGRRREEARGLRSPLPPRDPPRAHTGTRRRRSGTRRGARAQRRTAAPRAGAGAPLAAFSSPAATARGAASAAAAAAAPRPAAAARTTSYCGGWAEGPGRGARGKRRGEARSERRQIPPPASPPLCSQRPARGGGEAGAGARAGQGSAQRRVGALPHGARRCLTDTGSRPGREAKRTGEGRGSGALQRRPLCR